MQSISGSDADRPGKSMSMAGRKVLLVTSGGSFQKNGYYDELTKAFDEQKIEYMDFKGVTAPLLSKVREGAASLPAHWRDRYLSFFRLRDGRIGPDRR